MLKKSVMVAALALLLSPGAAHADWLFTPNIGGNFGGDSNAGFTYGASVAWMANGFVGVEGDFAFSPGIFETTEFQFFDLNDTGAQSIIANLIVGVPVGNPTPQFRPYGTVGLGWMQTEFQNDLGLFDLSQDSWAMSVGGGVMGFVSEKLGFRGDIRYYRAFTGTVEQLEILDVFNVDIGDITFWRANGGVTFRW